MVDPVTTEERLRAQQELQAAFANLRSDEAKRSAAALTIHGKLLTIRARWKSLVRENKHVAEVRLALALIQELQTLDPVELTDEQKTTVAQRHFTLFLRDAAQSVRDAQITRANIESEVRLLTRGVRTHLTGALDGTGDPFENIQIATELASKLSQLESLIILEVRAQARANGLS